MADDPLAASLAEIRERNEQLRSRYGYVGGLLVLAKAERDVPRLLAAVEAVLKLHALTGYHWHTEPCYEHRDYGRARSAGCPDCKVVEWTGCDTCKDEHGNPARPEDCKTRQAITAALTGEEKPDVCPGGC